MNAKKTPKIRVLIRKRPMNKKELARNETDIISVENSQTVVVRQQKLKVDLTPYIDEYKFNFDGAYDQFATNQQIYVTSIRPLVDCAFDGARVSCFAYGQTGSGKTHTMLGNGADVRGLYLLAAMDIFQELGNFPQLDVWVSFYEIYCGKLYDLLNEKNILYAREDAKNNVNIVGLSETKIHSAENLMQIIEYGTGARVTSQNGTNNDSSRSHAILQITLKSKNKIHGKISFIDLAGSERAADHADQLEKQTRIDGAEINKSLLALKECIRALDQNKHHTPFRGSKLTMVLKDSFTGYCRTVMIGNVSPNSASSQNTLNTLKYADRVKELKKPSRENFLQMEKIDQLEKQLMLPRNNLNKKSSKHGQQNAQGFQEFRENINSNIQPSSNNNYQKAKISPNGNGFKGGPGFDKKKLNNLNINNFVNRNGANERRNSPNLSKKPLYGFQRNFEQNKTSFGKEKMQVEQDLMFYQNNKPSNLVQQNQPSHVMTEADLIKLSEKHDEYVQLILQEEESLLRHHEQHINNTIELTKEEMAIKAQADKIGSRIEDYLEGLQDVLEKKMQSIWGMKQRIQQIRGHLQESKSLQEQYSACTRSMDFMQQREDQDNLLLLDDDEGGQLFSN